MTWALPVWTLLVWATRIRNVVDQDGIGWSLVVPLGMTVLAVATLADRRRPRTLVPLAAATLAVWGVRLPFVLVHDHPAGFKVVHAVLAVVSVALAVGAAAQARRRAVAASPTPPR